MVIEFLYNELTLYGENQNLKYFELLFPEAKIVKTKYYDTPYFVNNKVDILYIGPMEESWLQKVYSKLFPYRKRLIDLIEDGIYFFIFNSAMDIFGKDLEIKNPINKKETNYTLGIFDYHTIRDYDNRKSKIVKYSYEGEIIIGVNAGFSNYYGNEDNYIYESLVDGQGFNKDTRLGGYRYKNTFISELVALPLISNPYLAKKLSIKFNGHDNIPLEKEMEDMYNLYLTFVEV